MRKARKTFEHWKSTPLFGFIFLLGMAFLFTNCEEKDLTSNPGQSSKKSEKQISVEGCEEEVENQEGVLYFPDTAAFHCVMENLINEDSAQLDEFEDQLNFTSMRTNHNEREEKWEEGVNLTDPDDTVSNRMVEDRYFATVLNPDGKIQIADTLYDVNKQTVEIHTEDGELVKTIDIQRETADTTISNIQRGEGETVIPGSGGITTQGWGWTHNCPSELLNCNEPNNGKCNHQKRATRDLTFKMGGDKVRIKGQFYNVSYYDNAGIPHNTAGVRIWYEKRVPVKFAGIRWGWKWKNSSAPFLRIAYDMHAWTQGYNSNRYCCDIYQWGTHKLNAIILDDPVAKKCMNGKVRFEWNNPPHWDKPHVFIMHF